MTNNNDNNNSTYKRTPKSNFLIKRYKCPIRGCRNDTEVAMYFMVGKHKDIKSFYSMLCIAHGAAKRDFYIQQQYAREVRLEEIDKINERTQKQLDDLEEQKK